MSSPRSPPTAARSEQVWQPPPKRRTAAERERDAVLAAEPAFTLQVLAMSGSSLATVRGAKPGWTRAELYESLALQAPPPSGQLYKLIVGGRALVGALTLRDLGVASHTAEIYAVLMTNEALPILAEARDGLQWIQLQDIVEVRSMKVPPASVLLVFEAICVLLSLQPTKVKAQNGRGFLKDYWSTSQELMRCPQTMLDELMGLDPDINACGICQVLGPYVDRDDFQPQRALLASRVSAALCQWCHALHAYCRVAEASGLA